jgi:hypothetical protein
MEVVAAIFRRTSESGQVHPFLGVRPCGRAPFLCLVSSAVKAILRFIPVAGQAAGIDLPFTLPADQSHGGVRQAVAQYPGLGFDQGVRQAERP